MPCVHLGARQLVLTGFVLVSGFVLLLTLSPSVSRAATSDFLLQFGKCATGPCLGPGETSNDRGLAADPATGHVFVSESGNRRISEFTSWGQFVKSWGFDVAPGAVNEQQEVVVRAGTGQFRLTFGAGGPGVSETSDIPVRASAREVEDALNAIANVSAGGGSVAVSGGPAGPTSPGSRPYIVSFNGGALAGTDVAQVAITNGTVAPSGGSPSTELLTRTRANGAISGSGFEVCTAESGCQGGVAGSAGGQLNGPNGLAVDSHSAVYVVDATNRRIQKFSAAGVLLRSWGWDVIASGPGQSNEIQTVTVKATAGQFKLTFGGATTGDIAHDASAATVEGELNGLPPVSAGGGSVSVSGGPGNEGGTSPYIVTFDGGPLAGTNVAQMTAASGTTPLSGGSPSSGATVVTTNPGATGFEVCVPANGDTCKAGTTGSGVGQFGAWKTGAFLAIDSTDVVYVGDNNRVQKFGTDGEILGAVPLAGCGFVEGLAVDSAHNLYAICQNVPNAVRKVSGSGSVLSTVTVSQPQAVSTDVADHLFVSSGSAESQIVEYDSSGSLLVEFGKGEFNAARAIATNRIGQDTQPGDLYVGNSVFENGFVKAYGPRPMFEAPPAVPPAISDEHVSSVDGQTATAEAQVNANFWDSHYFVEYGTADCSSNPCTQVPAPPSQLSGEDRGAVPVSISLAGLTPGTTYHYRFVASSECEPGEECVTEGTDHTFTTPREAAAPVCSNDSLRAGPGVQLPDCRAYEMVSPPNKNSAEISVPGSPAGGDIGTQFSVAPVQAASSGEALAYVTATSFGADPQSAPLYSEYRSTRDVSGWMTENINPRFEEGYLRDPLVGFSPDLGYGAVIAIEPPLTDDATRGFPNLYSRNSGTGALTAMTTIDTVPVLASGTEGYCLSFAGASTDFDRVFFAAKGALLAGDPVVANGFNLYEWAASRPASERVRLVSVLPTGVPSQPTGASGFGGGANDAQCKMEDDLLRHAVAADGSRAFWKSTQPFYEKGPGEFVVQPLLASVEGVETVQLDAIQGGSAFFSGEGEYWDASADGSKVFFTDALQLTPGANGNDLYRYDFDAAGEKLANLTAHSPESADVRGVIGTDSRGSYVYFVAGGVLDEIENSQNEMAAPGANNLYVWHDGTVRFIARFGGEDAEKRAWSRDPRVQNARLSPNGQHLVFVSSRSLTGYDNQSIPEVYLYDAGDDELICASCNPTGARPLGSAEVPGWTTPYEQPRYLSEAGDRVFFESVDALVPWDKNGKRDVYQWEALGSGTCTTSSATFSGGNRGCIDAISTGTSNDNSYLLDASARGRDVFITTRQPLVPQDEDERFDAYDVRVSGGFPYETKVSCEAGEACRGESTHAPGASSPGTAAFVGPPSRHPKRPCAKGKRRVKRHGKVRCVRRHRHRAHKNHHRKGGKNRHGKKRANGNRRAGK